MRRAAPDRLRAGLAAFEQVAQRGRDVASNQDARASGHHRNGEVRRRAARQRRLHRRARHVDAPTADRFHRIFVERNEIHFQARLFELQAHRFGDEAAQRDRIAFRRTRIVAPGERACARQVAEPQRAGFPRLRERGLRLHRRGRERREREDRRGEREVAWGMHGILRIAGARRHVFVRAGPDSAGGRNFVARKP